jgi:hypothetical protein
MIKHSTLLKTLLMGSSLFFLYSCSKAKNNNVDQLATLGHATVSGKVTARIIDTVGAASSQHPVSGTVLTAYIDSRQLLLVSDNSATYLPRHFSTTVDGSGNYSFTFDVSPYQPAVVNIDSIVATVTKNAVGVIHHDSIYTVKQTFHPYPNVFNIKNNDALTQDINLF